MDEVNGLSVDWLGQHVYWTNAKKGTIELCDYGGHNRKVIVSGLGDPRGIVIDPRNG